MRSAPSPITWGTSIPTGIATSNAMTGPAQPGRERVSWDQALTEIAAKLNQIKEESGPEAVAAAAGTLRTDDWARRRFLNFFGTPNGFHNALLCWIPTFMIETAISG